MSDGASHTAKLRERLTTGTEDKLGRALADLLDNPLVTGTIGRAFDARERAVQAHELALSALNIPTAADIERLTRRLRSVSQRLEGIEDGVHRLNRALTEGSVERRLAAMEEQLKVLSSKLSGVAAPSAESASPRETAGPSSKSAPLRGTVGPSSKSVPSRGTVGPSSKSVPSRVRRTPSGTKTSSSVKKSASKRAPRPPARSKK